ncbi:uncharacterized protein LOC114711753 [Neltuma alba]|uniref:uncharacterized protein LOC114711753 n=1 Tax=Neltuma alba TaxID=207710 RepID=UPI0010A586F6|nr:uncharacterized protein LOC114711753 [Prosopis alba]
MASSSSLTTGRSRRRVNLIRAPSHEDNYEGPTRYCHHRLVAPRWMAWTESNPGQRFYGCRHYYQDRGCGYFAWHDGRRLCNEVDAIHRELRKLKCRTHTRESEVRKAKNKLKIAVVALMMTWV